LLLDLVKLVKHKLPLELLPLEHIVPVCANDTADPREPHMVERVADALHASKAVEGFQEGEAIDRVSSRDEKRPHESGELVDAPDLW